MEAEEKEKLWLMKRCGKITSSAIGKLMVSGRREMTPRSKAFHFGYIR